MPTGSDLTGRRFARLTVVERVRGGWRCRCDCGNETTARTNHLLGGNRVSCGCARRTARSAQPAVERKPCACGCGRLAKPGNRWVHGHHRRGPDWRERLDAARREAREEACEARTCEYRPVPLAAGQKRLAPPCGRPAEPGSHLCALHATAPAYTSGKPEAVAARELQRLVQRCAGCGCEWEATLGRARAAWEWHQRHCAALAESAA